MLYLVLTGEAASEVPAKVEKHLDMFHQNSPKALLRSCSMSTVHSICRCYEAFILSQWGYPNADVSAMRSSLERLALRAAELGARRQSTALPSQVWCGWARDNQG